SAEPAKKDHIRVSWTLPPGSTATVDPKLKPGRYNVVRSFKGGWYLDVEDSGASSVKWEPSLEGTVVKASPNATIEMTNDSAEPQSFMISEAQWPDHALRAGQLLSFQDFRDLFSEEYIGADVRLGV
ncbi:MAG: hypothetical protein ABI175_01985, partial [Polyangiales bacterium]